MSLGARGVALFSVVGYDAQHEPSVQRIWVWEWWPLGKREQRVRYSDAPALAFNGEFGAREHDLSPQVRVERPGISERPARGNGVTRDQAINARPGRLR